MGINPKGRSDLEVSGLILRTPIAYLEVSGLILRTPIAYLEVSGLIVLVDLIDNYR